MSRLNAAVAASLVLSAFAAIFAGLALLYATGVLNFGVTVPQDFETQARTYLLENPEVLVESFQLLEERRQAAENNELATFLSERRDEIFNDPDSPVAGNPDGDVALVEFFDYNCPYCRKAAPLLAQAEEADPNLKLVFKEWPILGPGSEFAAKAALAARNQGKYEAFHKTMMAYSGSIDESATMAVAAEVGLDVEQLKGDMEDPAIAAAIERNRALATDLRITGTPTFVVGDEVIRGLVDLNTLQRSIAAAREQAEG
jgi:protein-disulfide isomerase